MKRRWTAASKAITPCKANAARISTATHHTDSLVDTYSSETCTDENTLISESPEEVSVQTDSGEDVQADYGAACYYLYSYPMQERRCAASYRRPTT